MINNRFLLQMLKETLSAGVAYLHEGVEPSDRRLVQQLLESGAVQLCVVAAELAFAFAAHVHTVIIADTHTWVSFVYKPNPTVQQQLRVTPKLV